MFDIILALLAAIFGGIGLFLQKIGLKKIKKIKNIFFSFKWLSGTLAIVTSFFLYLLALKIGRLVIVQPLINISILILVFLEIVFLKTKIKKYEILALFLFFIGLVMLQVQT